MNFTLLSEIHSTVKMREPVTSERNLPGVLVSIGTSRRQGLWCVDVVKWREIGLYLNDQDVPLPNKEHYLLTSEHGSGTGSWVAVPGASSFPVG
jgi:hypothetical protein